MRKKILDTKNLVEKETERNEEEEINEEDKIENENILYLVSLFKKHSKNSIFSFSLIIFITIIYVMREIPSLLLHYMKDRLKNSLYFENALKNEFGSAFVIFFISVSVERFVLLFF